MAHICIVDADTVGGYLGVELALTDQPVDVLAYGATLRILRIEELRLAEDDNIRSIPVHASNGAHAFDIQDVMIIAIKAPAMESVAQGIAPLVSPEICMVVTMNGVPRWFFDRHGSLEGLHLQSVNPHGRITRAIPAKNVLGCVVHLTCSTAAPGHVRHGFGKRLILGEPTGGISPHLSVLGALSEHADLRIEHSKAIQRDIWFRL